MNNDGKRKKGAFHGDLQELTAMLRKSGYYLVKAREEEGILNKLTLNKYTSRELSILCSHMQLMLNAGISVSETIQTAASMEKRPKIKARLLDIYSGVVEGTELNKCINKHRDIFPDIFTNMIKLGEHSGNLELVLNNLHEYFEKDSKIKSKVKNSMTYPVVVFVTSMAVIAVLIIKVVPQFTETLKSLGGELPGSTAAMLKMAEFIKKNFLYLVIMNAAAYTTVYRYFKSEKGKYKIQCMKLKLPFIKVINEKILMAKFSRSLSTLMNSGFNIIRSLEICSEISENKIFGEKIKCCAEYIKKGESISCALTKSGLNNSMLVSMSKTGEETGKMEKVLNKTADYFEWELEEILKKLITLIEPVMVISMSIVIGAFIMSIMMPMVSVMEAIK